MTSSALSNVLPDRPAEVSTAVRPAGLYECLGWYVFKGEHRYVLRGFDGHLLHLRQIALTSLEGLFRLYPDAEHWRRLYPRGARSRIDCRKAGTDLMRGCIEAGPWTGERTEVW